MSRAGWWRLGLACLWVSSGVSLRSLYAQEQPFDPNSSVRFNLPPDSPVSLNSWDVGESRATMRGGALTLDVHLGVSLRNSAPQRVRGITVLIVSQEGLPVGRASVSRLVDVGPGETFSLRVDVRLLRPASAVGPLVQFNLDGVLFDDLNFYGPNRLNSRRAMTFWEMEARRDRQFLKQVLSAAGRDGLQQEMLELEREGAAKRLDVRLNRSRVLSTSGMAPGRVAQFALLNVPNAPIRLLTGSAEIAGDEARAPHLEIENTSQKSVRYVEIGWLVKDHDGQQYQAGSVPGSDTDLYLHPGHRGELLQQAALRFSKPGPASSPLYIDKMTGIVTHVEFSDGKMWIPKRAALDTGNLLNALPPSPEQQRLADLYRKRGVDALIQELNRF